jgi:hypothetical protein
MINFPVAQAVHIKSKDFGNLAVFKLRPALLPKIFLVIPTPGCPRVSCQVMNASIFWKITLYIACGMSVMYV